MLPFFYHPELNLSDKLVVLDEATSKHCIQVLRMQSGDALLLTNGKGLKAQVQISVPERKRCQVIVNQVEEVPPPTCLFSLAICFTKNTGRNEWLLEKVTEIGCQEIIPVHSSRSEKSKYNQARWESILVSAMLQSQQCYLPQLNPLTPIKTLIQQSFPGQRLIAHCLDEASKKGFQNCVIKGEDLRMLIGPEGDFTVQEIDQALLAGYQAVSLGPRRLRTETAGIYACTVFNSINYE